MTENSAHLSRLADENTGDIKRLETPFEHFIGETLPTTVQYVTLGVKAVLLAPVAIAIPVAAAVVGGVTLGARSIHDYYRPRMVDENAESYRLDQKSDRRAFAEKYGEAFAAEFIKLAQQSGQNSLPELVISKKRGQAEYFTASGYCKKSNGGSPVIEIGAGALSVLNVKELSVITAHEMTHAKLNHSGGTVNRVAEGIVTHLATAALVVTVIAGGLPFLPVAGLAIAASVIDKTMDSIRSRHREKIADRAAVLVTGHSGLLQPTLKKLRDSYLQSVDKTPAPKGFLRQIVDMRNRLLPFIYKSHPKVSTRQEEMQRFEEKNPAWCARRRGELRDSFNSAVQKPLRGNFYKRDISPQASNNIT